MYGKFIVAWKIMLCKLWKNKFVYTFEESCPLRALLGDN